MKVRSLSRFFMGMLAMCAIAACSNDELDVNGTNPDPDASKDAVYMNVTVQLPTGAGTRSATKPEGGTGSTEAGQDDENFVKEILLVLADKNNNFIGYGVQTGDPSNISGNNKTSYATTQKISKTVLASYYGDDETLTEDQRNIYVYVFCNPTTDLKNKIDAASKAKDETQRATWYNISGSTSETPAGVVTGNEIWKSNYFLMSTSDEAKAKKKLPFTLKEWEQYDSESNAFNFSGINKEGTSMEVNNSGLIPVERTAARFDFADKSPLKATSPCTYDVVTTTELEEEEGNQTEVTKTILQIELQKMALVNMSKDFYYLRRVSDDGTMTNAVICGIEKGANTSVDPVKAANYVVDTDADVKKAGFTNADYSTHFNFCLGNVTDGKWSIDQAARNGWFASPISTILGKKDIGGGYRIWRYATENTIPGDENNQKQGITTGIVFKGKMKATEATPPALSEALSSVSGDPKKDAILYAYSNNLYVRWTGVRDAALAAGSGTAFYTAVFGTPTNTPSAEKGKEVYSNDEESPDYLWDKWNNVSTAGDTEFNSFREKAKEANFTLYQSSNEEEGNEGYFCYYYYWNRHNDNGQNTVMGPMEFGVVRNNVYKLGVTNISRLGHPRVPENDPDPVDPGDPDESADVYFTVSVEVLPWVVRVNNIEF